MIELNLLPKELRKRKRQSVKMPKLPVLMLVIAVAAVIGVVQITLLVTLACKKRTLRRVEVQWEKMQPQREETERIAREIAALEKKVIAVRKIAKPQLNWTRLLSGLNQATISNIWLSEFELDFRDAAGKKRKGVAEPVTLSLTGYALGSGEEATSRVAKFITSLKSEKGFSDAFEDIELENMRSREVSGKEAMMFIISCRVKPVKTVPPPDDKKTQEQKKKTTDRQKEKKKAK
ncbi:MAG: hypothetical protein ABIH74_05700 [Candidatus Omnitrophota bacterium]